MPAKPSVSRWVANVRLTVEKRGESPQVIKPGAEVKDPAPWLIEQGLVSPAAGLNNEESG